MDTTPDIRATISLTKTAEGGRRTPAPSGFSCRVSFYRVSSITTATFTFEDSDTIYPGDSVNADVRITSFKDYRKKIYEGQDFEMIEGEKVVGTGVVRKILR